MTKAGPAALIVLLDSASAAYLTGRGRLSGAAELPTAGRAADEGPRRFSLRRRVGLRRGLYRVAAQAVERRGDRARRTRANSIRLRVR